MKKRVILLVFSALFNAKFIVAGGESDQINKDATARDTNVKVGVVVVAQQLQESSVIRSNETLFRTRTPMIDSPCGHGNIVRTPSPFELRSSQNHYGSGFGGEYFP